jgi:hypothetical protein
LSVLIFLSHSRILVVGLRGASVLSVRRRRRRRWRWGL